MDRNGVLVVGSANMDLVVTVDRFPQPGETLLGNHFQMFPGGKGANQAVCSARLGSPTRFLGRMGQDLFGDRLKSSMAEDGIDLKSLIRDPDHPTGVALITVDETGENEIVVASGCNMHLSSSDLDNRRDLFSAADIVLTQLEIPLESVGRAGELARQQGASFILNPAPAQPLPSEILDSVDYLTPNETELSILTGMPVTDSNSAEKAARLLVSAGIPNIIVTLGKDGAMLVQEDRTKRFPSRQVEVVDTTAAGDAFNGALAVAFAERKSIEDAIQFANLVASEAVTILGAQSSLPFRATINALT
jgi:ribokinase